MATNRKINLAVLMAATVLLAVLAGSAALAGSKPKPPTTGTVQFKSSTYSVAENGGSVRIYVSRTGGSSGPASVGYATANGTATGGSDYTSKLGTLSWSDGDAADKSFDVTILNDSAYEGDETFKANLSGASGATLGSPSSATVTIADDDAPPPVAEYTVVPLLDPVTGQEVRANDWFDPAINNLGQIVLSDQTEAFAIDVDGAWVPVFLADFDWVAWATEAIGPELNDSQMVDPSGTGVPQVIGISDSGVVAGTVWCGVCAISDPGSDSLWRDRQRSFICRPVFDDQGKLLGYSAPEDLGVCQEYPANIDCVLNTDVTGINASGTVVGLSYVTDYTGGGWVDLPGDAFRITPVAVSGQLAWFADEDNDGINDLSELLDYCDPEGKGGPEAVDDVGRVYVRDGGADYVVLPDGTSALVGSSLDKLWLRAGNLGGLAVGSYDTGAVYHEKWKDVIHGSTSHAIYGPFMIQGIDTNSDGAPDVWFRDQNGDGRNDLVVPLGVLPGYSDQCVAQDVNAAGVIVGYGWSHTASTPASRALIWKDPATNRTPVDVNALVNAPGIVLTNATAITDAGAILCSGMGSDGIGHLYLLMPN